MAESHAPQDQSLPIEQISWYQFDTSYNNNLTIKDYLQLRGKIQFIKGYVTRKNGIEKNKDEELGL